MRSINIILRFSNGRYADALARGLCYNYTGLNVFFEEDLDQSFQKMDRCILLTDDSSLVSNNTIVFGNEGIPILTPLRDIMEKIKVIVLREYGIILDYAASNCKSIGVFSKRGGRGVTSFSVMLARLIAARTEKKVLLLNLGIVDDYNEWVLEDFAGVLSKKQFLLMKEEGIKLNIEEFIKEDLWGTCYFKPEAGHNTFFQKGETVLNHIIGQKYFAYIIVDFGKQNEDCIEICDEGLELLVDIFKHTKLNNQSTEYKLCNKEVMFRADLDYLELSMKGEFASCIELFIEESQLVF